MKQVNDALNYYAELWNHQEMDIFIVNREFCLVVVP